MSKVIGVNGRPSQFDDDWNRAISSAADYLTITDKPFEPRKSDFELREDQEGKAFTTMTEKYPWQSITVFEPSGNSAKGRI